ncbi:hypothetical protein P12x_004497 [Tundrisphaera lichenicola]|uniref:hypothetical protein n=1 Tax=Tundrisphaera lichenicola TaxID=2029860 RepID=UPI003EBB3CE5
MTEPRESVQAEPEDDGEGRQAPSRRFARLVESPAARRLALPRLAVAALAGILLLGLSWVAGSRLVQWVIEWVDAQPEQQMAFSEITLDPAPPPYIRTGAEGILKTVQLNSRRAEHFSVPSVDLSALAKDFRIHSPWVAEVGQIRRSYGRLEVPLVYRKPVALGPYEKERFLVVDKDAVILPSDDIEWSEKADGVDWVEKGKRYRVRGIDEPLLMILDVDPPASMQAGLAWKKAGAPDPLVGADPKVKGAARLAEFLQGRAKVTPGGKPAPSIVAILPEGETLRYFLRDDRENLIFWEEAPGAEPIGEPSAEGKWKMLLEWVDAKGPLAARWPNYLWLKRSGAEISKGRTSKIQRDRKP